MAKDEGPELVRDAKGRLVYDHSEFSGALKSLGWTAAGFAGLAGVDERTVRRWLRGKSPVPKWACWIVDRAFLFQQLSAQFGVAGMLPGQKRRPKGAGK